MMWWEFAYTCFVTNLPFFNADSKGHKNWLSQNNKFPDFQVPLDFPSVGCSSFQVPLDFPSIRSSCLQFVPEFESHESRASLHSSSMISSEDLVETAAPGFTGTRYWEWLDAAAPCWYLLFVFGSVWCNWHGFIMNSLNHNCRTEIQKLPAESIG